MHWIIKVEMWETLKLLKFNHSEQVNLSEEKDMLCVFGGRKLL